MGFYKWFFLVACLAFAGCSTQPNKCPSGYHQQSTLCLPN